ncbi:MAG: retropepsin-like domain-containing protein [Alistipes sp.]|nr:retropepsin-like domain-containing protein [Alistipes sp.]
MNRKRIVPLLLSVMLSESLMAAPKDSVLSQTWEIPYEIIAGGQMVIKVYLGGKDHLFIFDTGTSLACIKESLVEELGLEPQGNNYIIDVNNTRRHMQMFLMPSQRL